MSHLLHIDSSIRGEVSVSRRLTDRAADRWRAAHPDGTVTYRDLGTSPIPHLDAATGLARMVTAEQRTAAQDASFALSAELIDEIKQADTVLLGLPLYNFGPPSTVKAWVDHIIALGLSIDTETHAGLLGDTDFIVLASRGGGYGPGTPREGWDHAQIWLPHALSVTGLQPRFITAELTTADANPKMSHLKPLAAESLNKALAAIDQLWTADEDAALEGVFGHVFYFPGHGCDQPIRGRHRAGAGVLQHEASGAISVLGQAGPDASLAEQRCLLIARDAREWNALQSFRCGHFSVDFA